jgi:hypothetical protein
MQIDEIDQNRGINWQHPDKQMVASVYRGVFQVGLGIHL